MDVSGVAPVRLAECRAQPVHVARHGKDVNVIGHQAIGPDFGPRFLGGGGKQRDVMRIVVVFEEHALTVIAPLRDMVWNTGQDNARKAGHENRVSEIKAISILSP